MDFEYICDYRIVSVHTLTFHRRQAACPRERAGVAREASSCNAFAIATFSSCYLMHIVRYIITHCGIAIENCYRFS